MKYLKQIGKISIFLLGVLVVFGFSEKMVFGAEPTTEAECKAVTPNAGECRDDIGVDSCAVGVLHKYGTCGTGKVCCIRSGSVGSNCEASGRTGLCKEKDGCSSSTEDDLGVGKDCQKGAPNLPDLTCCSLKSSSSNPDVTCNKLQCGNGISGTCMPASPGCGNLTQYGSCGSNQQGGSVCCIPKDCSPTTTPTANTSGSTSLNYTPLENLPGFDGQSGDFATYFGNLYKLALWIVGISALFMLVVGGFLYLSSAGNTSLLGTAKKYIYSALIGLVIALISWLLLDTINGDLTNLKLSGLNGAIGTSGSNSSSGETPIAGSGSGCSGAETQSGAHCEDASQAVSDALKCIVDKLGSKKIQISSISEDSGGKSLFTQCRDSYSQPPCEHTTNSCHYGGKAKASKSCAADISNSYTSNAGAASKEEIKVAARSCGIPFINDEGNHVHISVSGCDCDGHK
ncbi:MAG: pilin [Candidatus Moraniibacteriota bacterium]